MKNSGKKDELNIRELYEDILNKYAAANGVVILEHLKIPVTQSSPDKLMFDGNKYDYDANTKAFCFIGEGSDLIGYTEHTTGTHPYIFSAFQKLAAALGLIEFPPTMSYLKSMYDGFKPSKSKSLLADDDVSFHGKLNKEDILHFATKQKSGMTTDTRRNTRSGRIWLSVPSQSSNKNVSVIVFWCREKDVTPDDLKSLKKNFKLGDLFWSATDSKNFNAYTDDYIESESGNVKELKSKIYPNLSHDDIVDILMRAHTGYKVSPVEQKVVWEFRGFDPADIKQITGGYDTSAEYNYRQRFSESKEE